MKREREGKRKRKYYPTGTCGLRVERDSCITRPGVCTFYVCKILCDDLSVMLCASEETSPPRANKLTERNLTGKISPRHRKFFPGGPRLRREFPVFNY